MIWESHELCVVCKKEPRGYPRRSSRGGISKYCYTCWCDHVLALQKKRGKRVFFHSCLACHKIYVSASNKIHSICINCFHESQNISKFGRGYIIPAPGKLQHHMIAEQLLKRKLIFGKDAVHHLNLVQSDNRLENLILLSDSDHKALHGILRCRWIIEYKNSRPFDIVGQTWDIITSHGLHNQLLSEIKQ